MRPAAKRISLRAFWEAMRNPLIYKNFAIHLFVLAPATLVLAYFATRLDHHFGWPSLPRTLGCYAIAAALAALGGVVVAYSYAYLLILGEGSPGSHLGGPQRLVTGGPYALVRHPSVIGKLLGVVALGVAVGSPTFLFGFVPALLAYSLLTNRFIQERYTERAFGESYRAYRAAVPMILPGAGTLWAALRGKLEPVEVESADAPAEAIPRYELAIYLVLLALILLGAWRFVAWITG